MTPQAAREIRSYLRRHGHTCYHNALPIQVVVGKHSPYIEGCRGHHETKSGVLVRHPKTYMRAKGIAIYVKSTRRIKVGAEWLDKLENDLVRVVLIREQKKLSAIDQRWTP